MQEQILRWSRPCLSHLELCSKSFSVEELPFLRSKLADSRVWCLDVVGVFLKFLQKVFCLFFPFWFVFHFAQQKDTVFEFDAAAGTGNGLTFESHQFDDLMAAMHR
jgi:predicted membrane metal-binding protein